MPNDLCFGRIHGGIDGPWAILQSCTLCQPLFSRAPCTTAITMWGCGDHNFGRRFRPDDKQLKIVYRVCNSAAAVLDESTTCNALTLTVSDVALRKSFIRWGLRLGELLCKPRKGRFLKGSCKPGPSRPSDHVCTCTATGRGSQQYITKNP